MDKGRDFVDGRRETGSGVLVISAEFGNFGTCIVDISTEGGNEFISGVPVNPINKALSPKILRIALFRSPLWVR